MAITPNTNIRLMNLPIEMDNKNQLTFQNLEGQTEYFLSLPAIEIEEVKYQRHDNVMFFPAHIDKILKYNYVMYQNNNYSNKWFYAYITNMEYLNDGVTQITIKTDVFQTWQFDIVYRKMFVEREHIINDTIGANTIPENLELGPYIYDNIVKYNGFDDMIYVILVTELTNGTKPLATNYGGIFYAGGAYLCENIEIVLQILQYYNDEQTELTADAIYGLYMIPRNFIDTSGLEQTPKELKFNGQDTPYYDSVEITKPNSLNGYTPKNKKLLTFPYCGLSMSNNNGSSNTYQYELFNEIDEYPNKCVFNIKGVPVIGGSFKCYPFNYKNNNEKNIEEEGLIAGKFPTLNWSYDEFTNWLTQNGVNLALGTATNLMSMLAGTLMISNPATALTGAGTVVNGALGIANQMGQVYEHSIMPNSARGNVNGGDINISSKANTYYFYQLSIKQEYAKIIDDYFSMYGYKTNKVKIPNLNTRINWNYIKTLECNIIGDIPQDDIQEIKSIFDNGVTLWHNPNTFLDYSQNN